MYIRFFPSVLFSTKNIESGKNTVESNFEKIANTNENCDSCHFFKTR